MKRYGFLYLLGFAGMVISIALDMMAPQITRSIIDDVIVAGRVELLMRLFVRAARHRHRACHFSVCQGIYIRLHRRFQSATICAAICSGTSRPCRWTF